MGDASDLVAFQLGNFAPADFVVDGVSCRSVESFIQALKFKDVQMQRAVCQMIGKEAKFAGKKQGKKVARDGMVYWKGETFPFHSERHRQWIEKGIRAKFSQDFESWHKLTLTGVRELIHETGQPESRFTSLPARQFVAIVESVRLELIASIATEPFDSE